MKFIFVNPNFSADRAGDAMEPLVFAILKRLTPNDIDIVLYDERTEIVPLDETADLVALSVQSFTARRAYVIADAYRSRGIPVVLGGIHATLLPEEAREHADAVCLGDAEFTWPDLVADFRQGALKAVYRDEKTAPLPDLIPDRSIFRGKRYLPMKLVQFGRGCRFFCDFCSVGAVYRGRPRHRAPATVAEEIRRLGARFFMFADDNVMADPALFSELLRALVGSGKRWVCQTSIDIAFDDSLLALMRQAGCIAVFVGFESFRPETLAAMNKGVNRVRDFEDAVRRFRARGLMVTGSFVFGYGNDDAAALEDALRFGVRAKLCLTQFNIAFPTPGTALYDRLKAEGRLLYEKWWTDEQFRYGRCFFRPAGAPPEALERGVAEARRRFNLLSCIFIRSLDLAANIRTPLNLALFWAANLVSRHEIRRKAGLRFG